MAPDEINGTEYTIKEAAERLGVSQATVRRRIKKGELRVALRDSLYGPQYMIPESEVNTAQVINSVVRVDRPIPLDKLLASLQLALQAHDSQLAARLDEITRAGNETTAQQLAALREEIRQLREAVAAPRPPWWRRWRGR